MSTTNHATRAEAALNALSAAEDLEDRAASEGAIAAQWQRWIMSWETRADYPPRWHAERLRDRLRTHAEKRGLRVEDLLAAINEMLPALD